MKASNGCVRADKPAVEGRHKQWREYLVKGDTVTNSDDGSRRALRAANYQTCVESRTVTWIP